MSFRKGKLKTAIADSLEQIGVEDLDEARDFLAALMAHPKFGFGQPSGRNPVDDEKLAILLGGIFQRAPDATLDEVVPAFALVLKERTLSLRLLPPPT
jgi:hypothetical protein